MTEELGTCRTMTPAERESRHVPKGVQAYLVTLDIAHEAEIILLRDYDIIHDEWNARAFSPEQWIRALPCPHCGGSRSKGQHGVALTGVSGGSSNGLWCSGSDGPDIGADVPGGGAV